MIELPIDFCNSMRDMLGEEEWKQLLKALNEPSPTSIRMNPKKPSLRPEGQPVDWCNEGIYLQTRPAFTFDPLLHAGCYYVQEASSMYLSKLIRDLSLSTPQTVLDLCAAPGGKSTLALAELPEGSMLVANEIMSNRANILSENLIKWGNPNVIVTNNSSDDFTLFTHCFDIVICDVPCSGEGMFRKDHSSIDEWSAANVMMCVKRQREIISNIWHTIKPGGHLIYSTCTYNKHEDEENTSWIAEQFGATILEQRRFMPHMSAGEGFFCCLLQKPETDEETSAKKISKKKNKTKDKQPPIPKEAKSWLSNSSAFTYKWYADTLVAFPTEHVNILQLAENSLHIIHSGVRLATMRGKSLIPMHPLAMSTSLCEESFPKAELSYDESIAYLRTEALALNADVPRGIVLVTYQNHPLGFVKNLGTRANNLYPSEWRIRKTNI